MSRPDATDRISPALLDLAGWSAGLAWADIPDAVRARAALVLLDDLGAMVAARDEPELRALRERIARSAGASEATVFDGSRAQLDRYSAALCNGTAADWCELDGGYRPVVCHAALYCIPALLAEAEASEASLRDVLLALLTGYEIVARVARCFTFADLVLHPHGGLATIGAAAAVAKLRRFDAKHMADAVNTAATMVLPGPFGHAVEGALIRNAWPGLCAQNGIRAADWVEIGVTGTGTSLGDVFVEILGANPAPDELNAFLGERWAILDGYHKIHACCQYGHSTVEALLEAMKEAGASAAGNIVSLLVETHPKGRKLDNAHPATTLAAKFSIQHIAAATAFYGHAGQSAFSAAALADPNLAALRQRISIGAFEPLPDWPNDRPARVALTLRDGHVLRAECLSARGGADRPFNAEEILRKAARSLGDAYPNSAPLLAISTLDPNLLQRSWKTCINGCF